MKTAEKKKTGTQTAAADVNQDKKKATYADDFFPTVLTPTKLGKQRLDNIKAKKSEKQKAKQLADSNSNGKDHPKNWVDLNAVSATLDPVAKMVSETGNYKKSLKHVDLKKVIEFIDSYENLNRGSIKTETAERFDKVAKKIIQVAKSFYEYGDGVEFLKDSDYDRLLAAYLTTGSVEPMGGILPKGKKGAEKVKITYPTLHNNMDKSYRVHETDPIPDGVKEKDSVEKFLQRAYKAIGISSEKEIAIEISPKIDGCSINGTVDGKNLHKPQTRGDAEQSVLVKGLDNATILKAGENVESEKFGIQFEAFCTDADRVAASEHLGLADPYASCRHAAAGIMSRLSSGEDERLVKFLGFYPIMTEGLEGSYEELMKKLQSYGRVPKDMIPRKIIKGNLKDLLKKIEKEFQSYQEKRTKLSFAIDGMVLTVVDDDYQKAIGRDGRTNKYQIALKFDPGFGVSHVKGVWLDNGRKGFRTVQVDLDEPVYLDGVKYDHVPVLSAGLFDEMEIREGAEVEIRRVGDVIPAIKVISNGKGKKITLPTTCECGHELVIKAKKLYCSNPVCPLNIVGRLTDFMDKIGMESYGSSFVELLHNKFGVNSIADMFTMIDEDIAKASGINNKKLLSFHDDLRVAVAKTADFKIIGAFGIPGVGDARAKELLKAIPLNELFEIRKAIGAKAISIENTIRAIVGPETVRFAMEFLQSDTFAEDIRVIVPNIKKITTNFEDVTRVGHSGADLSDEVKALCDQLGFEVTDGKSFDILIVSSHGFTSGKTEAASKKGLPIMTEEEFLDRYKK